MVGQRVTAFLDHRASIFSSFSLRLTKPDGSALAYCDFKNNDCEIDNVTLPTTGVYTLTVDGSGASTGDYTLCLNLIPGTAEAISYDQCLDRDILPMGDQDDFTFSGIAGQRVTVFLDHRASIFSSFSLRLTKPDGSSLAYCDFKNNDCEIDNVTLPTTGVYTLTVDGSGASTGDYTLCLNLIPGTAEAISYDQCLDRDILPMGDQDVFTFSGVAGKRVTIFLDHQASIFSSFSLRLSKQDGISLAYCNFKNSDCEISNVTLPITGVYTLTVDGSGASTGNYALCLTCHTPPCEDSGTVTIAGAVNYYKNDAPVREVSMALTGGGVQTVPTNVNGEYQFNNLASGNNYTVTPGKSGGVGNSISAFDAAQVLQHTVGIITLDANQQKAADVSNNGSVSSFDAALILQYTVGIIDTFPVGRSWGFVPSEKSYTPLLNSLTGENYLAIVYGDVSGNWSGAAPVLSKAENQIVQLSFAPPRLDDDGQLRIPVTVSASEEIAGVMMRLSLDFDSNLLRSVEVSGGKEAGLAAFSAHDRTVTLAAAFGTGKTEQQIELIFASEARGQSLKVTELNVNDAMAQTVSQQLALQPGNVALPKDFELSQNYPNPFNPSTAIQFSLPRASDVEIRVFNIYGQLVKFLLKSRLEAGVHTVNWNGRDEHGRQISSGTFIVEMRAGDFHARRKIVMLK
jgi:hypothetical protein